MIFSLHKTIALFAAVFHLCGSVGYAGIAHYCRMQHPQQAVEERCCCAADAQNTTTDCCDHESGTPSETSHQPGHGVANQGCCELVALFYRVQESASSAPSSIPFLAIATIHLLPLEKAFHSEITEHFRPSIADLPLCLPLLI